MSCSACGEDKKIVARGWCRACYSRWYTRGTTDYAPKPQKVACSVGGCTSLAIAKGMCDKHYRRMKDHGTTDANPDLGKRSKHPLYGTWKHMRRYRGRQNVCQEWLDDFWTFVFDVGEKPSDKYRLYSADESLPLGPDNYVWKKSLTHRVEGEDRKTYMNRAQKTYRKARKEAFQGYEMKRKYGLSAEEHKELHDAQDGKCAICGKEEWIKINGQTVSLAIDHCHSSGEVRGLLCNSCNRGLGLFFDNPDLLKAAQDYILSFNISKGFSNPLELTPDRGGT